MNKKELRKELEFILVKGIEHSLLSINAEATREIAKYTVSSAKTLAKKFYKIVKQEEEKKQISLTKKSAKKSTKPVVKKAAKKATSKAKK